MLIIVNYIIRQYIIFELFIVAGILDPTLFAGYPLRWKSCIFRTEYSSFFPMRWTLLNTMITSNRIKLLTVIVVIEVETNWRYITISLLLVMIFLAKDYIVVRERILT